MKIILDQMEGKSIGKYLAVANKKTPLDAYLIKKYLYID